MCSDYLLYTVTASAHILVSQYFWHYWNSESESPVECLQLSFEA